MLNMRTIDLMTYNEKVIHFMRPDAWRPDGQSLHFKKPKFKDFRIRALAGDVRLMPLLVGRPCFGIITAHFRQRDAVRVVPGRGLQPDSRCASCPIAESCNALIMGRVRSNERLREAHQKWAMADGPRAFAKGIRTNHKANDAWDSLCSAAKAVSFTTVNDDALRANYQRLDEVQRAKDVARKRRDRERNRKQGVIDDEHVADIVAAADEMHVAVVVAHYAPDAPKWLTSVPEEALWDLRDVWIGREIMRAKNMKPNAPNIARWIKTEGRRNSSTTDAALFTRVAKDLRRIEKFEAVPWGSGKLIAPFSLAPRPPSSTAPTL